MDGMKHHATLIDLMTRAASRRKCQRRATVCAVLMDGMVIYSASNGPIEGMTCAALKGACGCAHAEARALAWAVGNTELTVPHRELELLSYLSPCSSCANSIVLFTQLLNIKRVMYAEEFEDQLGKRILMSAGIEVLKVDRL